MNSFWFHYNKPASRKAGKPKLTVHYKNQCLLVSNICCQVDIYGRIRNRQPFFVMAGKCKDISIIDGVAIIT